MGTGRLTLECQRGNSLEYTIQPTCGICVSDNMSREAARPAKAFTAFRASVFALYGVACPGNLGRATQSLMSRLEVTVPKRIESLLRRAVVAGILAATQPLVHTRRFRRTRARVAGGKHSRGVCQR